jgi:hypothetical protein
MIMRLKGMFENQVKVDRFRTSKAMFGSRLAEGEPVSPHLINMIGHVESLGQLCSSLDDNLAIDVILRSLPPSFEPLTLNYYMNGLNKTRPKLHGMLKQAEESLRRHPVM